MAQDGLTAQAEIARLTFQLARYRGPSAHGLDPWGAEFGRSSEKLARDTEQLELALETLETDQAERLATASPAVAALVEAEAQKPARRPLPEHLPREDLRHPAPCTCPSCGGALRKISDEVTETLDYVPAGSRACLRESGGDPAHLVSGRLRNRRHTSNPHIPGNVQSSSTTCGWNFAVRLKACCPFAACSTRKPRVSRL